MKVPRWRLTMIRLPFLIAAKPLIEKRNEYQSHKVIICSPPSEWPKDEYKSEAQEWKNINSTLFVFAKALS